MGVAALFLEVEDHPHIGELHRIDRVGPRLTFGADLGVERAGLQADVVGLDLRKELREFGENAQFGGLGIGGVDDDLALRSAFSTSAQVLKPWISLASVQRSPSAASAGTAAISSAPSAA